MIKRFLEIGKITKTQGLKGEVRVQFFCDDADVIGDFETLYLNKGEMPVEVEYCRPLKNDVVVMKFEGVDIIEEAQKYIGKMLYMDREDVELPEDTWFIQDLIGLDVIDADSGRVYGKVDDVLQNGPTDVYSIKTPEGKTLMFPSIPEVLLETDVEGGKLVIRPLPNLFELDGEKDED